MNETRNLILVLGDQLNPSAPPLLDADPALDVIAMAEVVGEIERFPNHKQRVVLFLSAMRHFRDGIRALGFEVRYQAITNVAPAPDLPEFLASTIRSVRPRGVVITEPGRHELLAGLTEVVRDADVPLELIPDQHFLCSRADFAGWAEDRKSFVMEHFYRTLRRRHAILMDGETPTGGVWNLDSENRESFLANPAPLPRPLEFPPDSTTRGVMDLVEDRWPDLPGSLEDFDWPVTPEDAVRAAEDFVDHRLPSFGRFQDAMWTNEPFLYHSRISAALNLKLIDPLWILQRAEEAYRGGRAPLNSVEGFIRQILGWREFTRGLYWLKMPDYKEGNALGAVENLPDFFWTGETEMTCIRQTVDQLIQRGYAHHIQRLMVSGLFAMLYGVEPRQIHEWFMAMYVDSVEWVTLPNVLGMSQYADGGVMGTKPYAATGKYIKRQSNYCESCRFDPDEAVGENACPFTTLYWDFLQRHENALTSNRRMAFQLSNLRRKTEDQRAALAEQAGAVRRRVEEGAL